MCMLLCHTSQVDLADKDKVDMEDEIRERVEIKGKTRIICRNGSPIDPNDLEITNPHSAKSIIVLPPENSDPDTDVIKTVLAITNNPNRRLEPYHIVTQIRNPKNMDVLKLVGEKDHVQAVETIMRENTNSIPIMAGVPRAIKLSN